MGDSPFMLPTLQMIKAETARDTVRAYKAMADHLRSVGVTVEASRMERDSNGWMAYSIALSQTMPPQT